MISAVLLAHASATWAMTGLIWFVQVVHYPLFARVGDSGFAAYEAAHQTRTTWVVGPLMIVEAATAVWLALARPPGVAPWAVWAGLLLLGLVWASTALLQVPQHAVLARGFRADAYAVLVGTNWIRTAAWTLRAALVVWMLRSSAPS